MSTNIIKNIKLIIGYANMVQIADWAYIGTFPEQKKSQYIIIKNEFRPENKRKPNQENKNFIFKINDVNEPDIFYCTNQKNWQLVRMFYASYMVIVVFHNNASVCFSMPPVPCLKLKPQSLLISCASWSRSF